MKRVAPGLAVLMMAGLACAGGAGFVGCVGEKSGGDRVKAGDAVPEFTVADPVSGAVKTFSQADFTGRRSMIVFFATWCSDCRRELPVIYEAWGRLKERADFQLIAISRQEETATVNEYWNSVTEGVKPAFEGMAWWSDADASAFNAFADSYIPRVYLVDTRGRVAAVSIEVLDMTAEKLVSIIEGLK